VKLAKYLIGIVCGLSFGLHVQAQAIPSFAVFDIEAASEGFDLVVGIQPLAAQALAGSFVSSSSTIQRIEANAEMIAAYIQSSVSLKQQGDRCSWDPKPETVAQDTITLHAEGVTVRGRVHCADAHRSIALQTDLFQGMFAEHRNIVRMKTADGSYRVIDQLDASHDRTVLDPNLAYASSSDVSTDGSDRLDVAWILFAIVISSACVFGAHHLWRRKRIERV